MSGLGVRALAPVLGVVLVGLHAFAFPVLLDRCTTEDLAVRVDAAPAAHALSVEARLPAGIADRTTVLIDGVPGSLAGAEPGAGLRRVEWQVSYRGGFDRRAGVTQLVGPFQDRVSPPCSVRLLVGQRFLDDGAGGTGTVVHLARDIVHRELTGMDQWPIGKFQRISWMTMRWSEARGGALEIQVKADFTRGEVPMKLEVVPTLSAGVVMLHAFADANVGLDNRVYQWVADLFDADTIAGATAEEEVSLALRDAFRPPPPVPLPGGRRLVFDYCPHQGIEVVADRYAAVPMRMMIEGARGDVLPVSFGPVWQPPIAETTAPLSLEFNLDAINAVLYYLWHSEFLDRELAATGVEARFNTDSAVRDLLSIEIGDIGLALPPVLSLADSGRAFDFAAETRLTIRDGATVTPARLYGAVGLDFSGAGDEHLRANLTLRSLSLTCEPEPGLLRPCYADLVGELSGRADELHQPLSRLFTDKFNQIVLGKQIGSSETLADFHIERAEVHTTPVAPTALIRVDLFGSLRSRP